MTRLFPPRFRGRTILPRLFSALAVLAMLAANPAEAEGEPPSPPPGKVFRLAYVQAYPYWSYTQTFEQVMEALRLAGWGDRVTAPADLRFSLDQAGDADEDYHRRAREILARDDYDLLLCFGTTATRIMLRENDRKRPMVGLSVSNPLGAGLIKSPTDSGADYFTTVTYEEMPGRYMFMLFHELLKFKSMGIMYHDDPDGRVYTYLNEARDVARDRGFELLEYNRVGAGEPLPDCVKAVRDLIDRGAEVLFIPNISCFDANANDLEPLFRYIYNHKKPTLVSEDRTLVRRFAMMGLFFSDTRPLAQFQAGQIIRILSGQSPGRVGMVAPFRSRIMLNTAAAAKLGLNLDLSLLALSDELYLSLPGLEPPLPPDRPQAP